MKLAYEAYDKTGRVVNGTIEAASAREATEQLYADGLYVTRLAGDANAGEASGGRLALGGKFKSLVNITRQLAILTGTGTPVVQALAAIERQQPPGAWRSVLGDIRQQVEEGGSLAKAMEGHPRHFDAVYRSLIAAGESGGQLPAMLDRLSVITRKQMKVRSTVMGALSYPIMLLAISIKVVVVMLLVVLPRFTGLFDSLGADLPPTTKMLLSLSQALRTYWWAALLGLGTVVGGVTWFLRSPGGRRWVDGVLVSLPVVGPFTRSLVTARIARTLGVLLESKVPLLEALTLTKAAAGNCRYADLLTKVEEEVTRGEPMSACLRESPLIAPSIVEAVVTGEQAGQVGEVLLNLADFMDEDNEVVIKSIMSLLEPAILIALGLVVGFVAISLFMPLFDLTSAAGGGA